MGLEQFAVEAIQLRLSRLLEFATAYITEPSPALLKKLRVWSRRTRTATNVFEPYFFGTAISKVQRQLKLASRVFGEARDIDVMCIALIELSKDLSSDQLRGVNKLVLSLSAIRESSEPRVHETVQTVAEANLQTLVRDLTMLSEPNVEGVCAVHLEIQYNAVVKFAYSLDDVREKVALHEMRIEAKRLRYLLELFLPINAANPEFDKVTSALIVLQDLLGSIHDSDILEAGILKEIGVYFKPYLKSSNQVGAEIDIFAVDGLMSICLALRHKRAQQFSLLAAHWSECQTSQVFEPLQIA